MSIHWGGIVLTPFLNVIVELFLTYDQLPWLRVGVVSIEILVIIKFLNGKSANSEATAKSVLKLGVLSIALFILAQFDYLIGTSAGFCGNALLDGSLDDLLDSRNRNESYVHVIEIILLSLTMLIYIFMQVKGKAHTFEKESDAVN